MSRFRKLKALVFQCFAGTEIEGVIQNDLDPLKRASKA